MTDIERLQAEIGGLRARLEAREHAPGLERLREQGLLPKVAEVATRMRAVEGEFNSLREIVVAQHDAIHEILEILKRAE